MQLIKRPGIIAVSLLVGTVAVVVVMTVAGFLRESGRIALHAVDNSGREAAAELAWRREFGDPVAALAGFPDADDSPAAVRLLELVRAPLSSQSESVSRDIAAYVSAELRKPGGPPDGLPDSARSHVDRHDADLRAIVDLLTGSEPIRWRVRVSRLLREEPLPALADVRRLTTWLIAAALNHSRLGRPQEAERTLHAAWSLQVSFRRRPEITSQFLAIAGLHQVLGVARRIPLDLPAWRRRLDEHDYRTSMLAAHTVEAIVSLGLLPRKATRLDRVSRADFLDGVRPRLAALRDSPFELRRPGPEPAVEPLNRVPSIGGVSAEMFGPAPRILHMVSEAVLELELTDRVLTARSLSERSGQWPAVIPDFNQSRVPGAAWIFVVTPDGRFVVSLTRLGDPPQVRFEGRE